LASVGLERRSLVVLLRHNVFHALLHEGARSVGLLIRSSGEEVVSEVVWWIRGCSTGTNVLIDCDNREHKSAEAESGDDKEGIHAYS